MHEKKGVSEHIEVIISFTIFLTFVVFLLIFVNPIEKTKEKTQYLDITEKTIMQELQTDLTTFSITIEPTIISGITSCFCFDYPTPEKVTAKDEENINTNAGTFGNTICVNPTQTTAGANKKHYKLSFSTEFTENPGTCTGPITTGGTDTTLNPGDYTLGVRNEYKKISKTQLISLNNSYNTNYQNLRSNLALKNNFNIIIKTTEGEQIAYGKIKEPKETDIIAKEIPIEILDSEGTITPAIMNLQVWE